MKTKTLQKNTTNKDLGFLFLRLDSSNSPIYDNIIEIANNRPYDQTCIFSSSAGSWSGDQLPIFHINEMKYFFGSILVFDIASLILTRDFPNLHKRIYYAFDLPWTENPTSKYTDWHGIFCQNNLEIVCQNKNIYDIYEICWKKPLSITSEINYESISEIIK